jgi:hypothetical protein
MLERQPEKRKRGEKRSAAVKDVKDVHGICPVGPAAAAAVAATETLQP